MDSGAGADDSTPQEKNNPATGEKRKREMKTRYQLKVLEQCYAAEAYPSESKRAELSDKIGLSERQIHMWLCHRRLKDRKVEPNKRAKLEEENNVVGQASRSYSSSGQTRRVVYEAASVAPPQLSAVELRIIAMVEGRIGKPLREDGPILGVEFEPLPPGSFGAPKEININIGDFLTVAGNVTPTPTRAPPSSSPSASQTVAQDGKRAQPSVLKRKRTTETVVTKVHSINDKKGEKIGESSLKFLVNVPAVSEIAEASRFLVQELSDRQGDAETGLSPSEITMTALFDQNAYAAAANLSRALRLKKAFKEQCTYNRSPTIENKTLQGKIDTAMKERDEEKKRTDDADRLRRAVEAELEKLRKEMEEERHARCLKVDGVDQRVVEARTSEASKLNELFIQTIDANYHLNIRFPFLGNQEAQVIADVRAMVRERKLNRGEPIIVPPSTFVSSVPSTLEEQNVEEEVV